MEALVRARAKTNCTLLKKLKITDKQPFAAIAAAIPSPSSGAKSLRETLRPIGAQLRYPRWRLSSPASARFCTTYGKWWMTSRACTTSGNKQTRRSVDHRGQQRGTHHMGSGGRCRVCHWVVASTKAQHQGDGSTLRPWRSSPAMGRRSPSVNGSTRRSRRRVGEAPRRRVLGDESAELLSDGSTRRPRAKLLGDGSTRLPRGLVGGAPQRCGFLDSGGVPRRRIEEGNQRRVGAVCLLAHGGTHGGLMNRRWNLAHGSLRPPRGVRGESGRRIWKSGGGSGFGNEGERIEGIWVLAARAVGTRQRSDRITDVGSRPIGRWLCAIRGSVKTTNQDAETASRGIDASCIVNPSGLQSSRVR